MAHEEIMPKRPNRTSSFEDDEDDAVSEDHHNESTNGISTVTPLLKRRRRIDEHEDDTTKPPPDGVDNATSTNHFRSDTSDKDDRRLSDETDSLPLPNSAPTTVLPTSMQLMKPFWAMCCRECGTVNRQLQSSDGARYDDADGREAVLATMGSAVPSVPPLRSSTSSSESMVETLIHEYIAACNLYGCSDRINAGVLTALRFSLPTIRCSGNFHDADMLALCELLLKHCNTALKHVRRLDFTVASKEGKLNGRCGFKSHGAFTLSNVLRKSRHIEELFLQRNRIGPFGASAIFQAASVNSVLRTIVMRGCVIGERGALAFAEYVCSSAACGLREVDLSVNAIGFQGSVVVERALIRRENIWKKEGGRNGAGVIEVDLEGNLIFQEVMNCITHGLGVVLCIIGTILLSKRVQHKSTNHIMCCAVYSISLLTLYLSSTLFHSFFALTTTKYIFGIFDHCAIYILIAGSYTPFLGITLADKPLWSTYLLAFIWICCLCGIFVEAFHPTWIHKSKFSLAMYLGMGWACMVCTPDLLNVLPQGALNLLVLGGVGYTSGVPFFVRNNNLDHSIWHCFVLGASVCHWFGVFSYVAPLP